MLGRDLSPAQISGCPSQIRKQIPDVQGSSQTVFFPVVATFQGLGKISIRLTHRPSGFDPKKVESVIKRDFSDGARSTFFLLQPVKVLQAGVSKGTFPKHSVAVSDFPQVLNIMEPLDNQYPPCSSSLKTAASNQPTMMPKLQANRGFLCI